MSSSGATAYSEFLLATEVESFAQSTTAQWSSRMIPALGVKITCSVAGGPGFKSRLSPFFYLSSFHLGMNDFSA